MELTPGDSSDSRLSEFHLEKERLKRIHIYVDGSCLGNRNVTSATEAGWGFCVIEGDSSTGNGKGELVVEMAGKVITNSNSSGFIGAEVGSNNTAELSAIAHSLKWLMLQNSAFSVTIRGDSKYALNISTGSWKAKSNRELAKRVQSLWADVSKKHKLLSEHVAAHRGHRWNERADHLAFRAMKGEKALPLQFWKPGVR